MRLVTKLTNANDLKTFLKSDTSEFVDVLITVYGVSFIFSSEDVFITYDLDALEREDITEPIGIRLPRAKIVDILVDGYIEFKIEDKLTISFKTNTLKLLFSIQLTKQIAYISKYSAKIQMIADMQDYPEIEIAMLEQMVRIAKKYNTSVSVTDGIAFMNIYNTFVFKKVDLPNLCLNGNKIGTLLKFAKTARNMKGYLAMSKDNYNILLRKDVNNYDNTEYRAFENIKYNKKYVLNLESASNIITKARFSKGKLTMDLNNNSLCYSEDDIEFTIPFETISNDKSETTSELDISLDSALSIVPTSEQPSHLDVNELNALSMSEDNAPTFDMSFDMNADAPTFDMNADAPTFSVEEDIPIINVPTWIFGTILNFGDLSKKVILRVSDNAMYLHVKGLKLCMGI